MARNHADAPLPPYFDEGDLDLDAFAALCARRADPADHPLAERVEKNIPIYRGDTFRDAIGDPERERELKRELTRLLRDGPGVFAVAGATTDLAVIDRSTALFRRIVSEERDAGGGRGDHFGSNERIWNAIQKACLLDPDLFIDYYGNPVLALACESWLGPGYQITAQMNNVKPGSSAQAVHRDYHLGFQAPEVVERFPAHAQAMSQYLTLQGAIAHVDMPLESGPTLLLPFSHLFAPGYQAYTRPEFADFARAHMVQLPLAKGDMIFFSPALFHGAGTNRSDTDRTANLVQISSAFGRTMETLDHAVMVEAVYPALLARLEAGTIGERQLRDTVAATADGYSFPTNLDSDPPVGGNAPETGQQLMERALAERWPLERLREAMRAYAERRAA